MEGRRLFLLGNIVLVVDRILVGGTVVDHVGHVLAGVMHVVLPGHFARVVGTMIGLVTGVILVVSLPALTY